ncbi:MAG: hypothetical protein HY717_12315 [Planctomycetes bacterium]|nr:hypothetical protein [Planctomycetota bacterium]
MSLTLTNIPRIMRSKGWGNGARLMDIWFSRPSAVAPAYGLPDTATIKMDRWALTFARARSVYDQLIRDRIWVNSAAQAEIAKMLRRKGLPASGSAPRSFGNLSQPVELQDPDYINQRIVSFGLSDLDDMSAALGNFAFRVVVAGSVAAVSGGRGFAVTISEIGVYIRDSFDFNGSQFLGFWDDSTNSVSMVNPLSGTAVSNDDFRAWRRSTSRGGDFLVFSDMKRTSRSPADSFSFV